MPDLGHAEVAFNAIVGERDVGTPCEAQDVPSPGGEAFEKVVGIGPGDRSPAALFGISGIS